MQPASAANWPYLRWEGHHSSKLWNSRSRAPEVLILYEASSSYQQLSDTLTDSVFRKKASHTERERERERGALDTPTGRSWLALEENKRQDEYTVLFSSSKILLSRSTYCFLWPFYTGGQNRLSQSTTTGGKKEKTKKREETKNKSASERASEF